MLSIVYNIYTVFDEYPTLESRGFFLDISKAFDKIWHEGLILKLKSMVICDALLDLIRNFLENRFQRVFLNGQTAEWLLVRVGVPQGSILGSLFFLIYTNNLSIDIISPVKFFADNTSLFSIIHDAKTRAYELNKDLQKIAEWAHQWKMSFNPDLSRLSRLKKLFFQGK